MPGELDLAEETTPVSDESLLPGFDAGFLNGRICARAEACRHLFEMFQASGKLDRAALAVINELRRRMDW